MAFNVTLFLIIAFGSVIGNPYVVSVDSYQFLQSPHLAGDSPVLHESRPEVFTFKLYKNKELLRTCRGSEIATRANKILWLTAAECLDKDKYDVIELENRVQGKFVSRSFPLSKLKCNIHPEYNKWLKTHNIAIIIPPIYLRRDPRSLPIGVPEKGKSLENNTVDIYLEWRHPTAELDQVDTYDLYYIRSSLISNIWCKVLYPISPVRHNVCVSGWFGKGLLQKDIGIPLISTGRYLARTLVGIATVVRPWTRMVGMPIEFLSITPYLDWIQSIEKTVGYPHNFEVKFDE